MSGGTVLAAGEIGIASKPGGTSDRQRVRFGSPGESETRSESNFRFAQNAFAPGMIFTIRVNPSSQ